MGEKISVHGVSPVMLAAADKWALGLVVREEGYVSVELETENELEGCCAVWEPSLVDDVNSVDWSSLM